LTLSFQVPVQLTPALVLSNTTSFSGGPGDAWDHGRPGIKQVMSEEIDRVQIAMIHVH
jgi:hypothetical protein